MTFCVLGGVGLVIVGVIGGLAGAGWQNAVHVGLGVLLLVATRNLVWARWGAVALATACAGLLVWDAVAGHDAGELGLHAALVAIGAGAWALTWWRGARRRERGGVTAAA